MERKEFGYKELYQLRRKSTLEHMFKLYINVYVFMFIHGWFNSGEPLMLM